MKGVSFIHWNLYQYAFRRQKVAFKLRPRGLRQHFRSRFQSVNVLFLIYKSVSKMEMSKFTRKIPHQAIIS